MLDGRSVKEVLYAGFDGAARGHLSSTTSWSGESAGGRLRGCHTVAAPAVRDRLRQAHRLLALRARCGHGPDRLVDHESGAVPWETVRARRRPGRRAASCATRLGTPRRGEPSFTRAHLNRSSPRRRRAHHAPSSRGRVLRGHPRLYEWVDAGWLASPRGPSPRYAGGRRHPRVALRRRRADVTEDEHDAACEALGAEWPVERAEHWVEFAYETTSAPASRRDSGHRRPTHSGPPRRGSGRIAPPHDRHEPSCRPPSSSGATTSSRSSERA